MTTDNNVDIRFLGLQVQRLQDEVGNLRADVARFEAGDRLTFQEIAKVESELHALRREIKAIEASHLSRFEQVHSSITTITSFAVNAIKGLDTKIEDLKARTTRIEEKQVQLAAGQDRLAAGQDQLAAGVAKIEAGQAELMRDVSDLRSLVVANHEAVVTALRSRSS